MIMLTGITSTIARREPPQSRRNPPVKLISTAIHMTGTVTAMGIVTATATTATNIRR
jgi:hypothetical protein